MKLQHRGSLSGIVAALAFTLLSLGQSGCGGDQTGQQAAEINPEMEKQTQEMLSNLGKNYSQEHRAAKTAKKNQQ